MEFHHVSVLLNECIEYLNIKKDGIYIDGTMGGGGHSLAICQKLTTGKLIAIDKDLNAHTAAKQTLKDHLKKITFVHDNFENIKIILQNLNIAKVDGILLDIGVSSHQLDESERGSGRRRNCTLWQRF